MLTKYRDVRRLTRKNSGNNSGSPGFQLFQVREPRVIGCFIDAGIGVIRNITARCLLRFKRVAE